MTVLTAPNDGSDRFVPRALATTSADGVWSATLPAGPARLVEAYYGGTATTEPALSADAQVGVPAKIRLKVEPTSVPWGGRIVISGQLLGGYIPASKTAVSQLLRLRIGVEGISGTAGIPDVERNGRFRTSYCFNPGRGVVHFWFSVSTLNETDYPYDPSSSRRVPVTVGPGNGEPQSCGG